MDTDYESNVSTPEMRLYFGKGLFHTVTPERVLLRSFQGTLINLYLHARFKISIFVLGSHLVVVDLKSASAGWIEICIISIGSSFSD